MAKFLSFLMTLCLLQFSCGSVVKREVEVATKSPIAEFSKTAEEALMKFHSSFLDLFGVNNNTELVNLVDTESRKYAARLQTIVGDLTNEAQKYSGRFDDTVKEVKEKISETVRELETKNPEFFADTKKYQEKFETHLRAVMSETERLSDKLKKEAPELTKDLEKVAKDLYQTTAQTAKSFSEQVENVVKEQKNKL
ncbi:hypothetical protein DMENIID0001_153070 [Sergentomyia squamirostris]